MFGCRNNFSCLVVWVIAITLGIILGIVSFVTLIPGIIIALWIAFGIGAFGVLLTTVLALTPFARQCLCEKGKCLIIAAIGTVILTIIALAITIVTGSVAIAMLIGLVTAFLVATILSIFNILFCLIDDGCRKCKDMRID